MSITLTNLVEAFPNFSQELTKRIIDWYSKHPTKEISPSDILTAPFHKEVVEAGVEEYELADFLDLSPDDWVNSKAYHAILNEHYCSDYDPDDAHHYASGSNQFEDIEIKDDETTIEVVFDHKIEIICPVCWVKAY